MDHSVSDLHFRTSSYSQINNNNCVEVALLAQVTAVRDSKTRTAGHLTFPTTEWVSFLCSLKSEDLA